MAEAVVMMVKLSRSALAGGMGCVYIETGYENYLARFMKQVISTKCRIEGKSCDIP
jgi:hypothetical protein